MPASSRPAVKRMRWTSLERKGSLELDRQKAAAVRSLRQHQAQPLAGHAAGRERECGGARRIEPLNIVDRNEQRLLLNERSQSGEERNADRMSIGRHALRVLEQERDRQRSSLHLRKPRDDVVRIDEQVRKRGEGQRSFRIRRARDEHPELDLMRIRDSGAPQSGLADPWFAV